MYIIVCYTSSKYYNSEIALSGVVQKAYYSASRYYQSQILEMPAGNGYADIVFLPRPEFKSKYPALVIELKWNKTAKTAIKQIKDRQYPEPLKEYTDNILLVGINYNKGTKKHECVIEKYSAKPKDETIIINNTICYIDKIDTLASMANITREDVIEQLKSGILPIGFASHK